MEANIHAKRLSSEMVATQSLLDDQQLSLTKLERNITGPETQHKAHRQTA